MSDFEPSDSGTAAAVAAGIEIAGPKPLADDRFSTVLIPAGGKAMVLDREKLEDEYLQFPKRKDGKYAVHTAESFLSYVGKHGDDETEIWADEARQKLVGVIDAHGVDARWEKHRVELELVHTEGWKAWTGVNGHLISQTQFAELIEARSVDIFEPSAADMLELAQTFQATIGVDFKSSKLLDSGERQLAYIESTSATAGQKGQLSIPKAFTLALQPFVGGDTWKVLARFRYRISNGGLQLGISLERPEDVLREAFQKYVLVVEEGLEKGSVYYGRTA